MKRLIPIILIVILSIIALDPLDVSAGTTPPKLTHNSMTDHAYWKDGNHWVQPNQNVNIILEQYDNDSGNKHQYLRLDGNNQDVRLRHDFFGANGNVNNVGKGFTSSHISINSANRIENTKHGRVSWNVTPKTHGHTYKIMYYFQDNNNNNTDYQNTYYQKSLMTLSVDGVSPTHVSHGLSGEKYKNGNDYWVNSGSPINILLRQQDLDSGNRLQNLALVGSGVNLKANHHFHREVDYFDPWDLTSHVTINSALRTEDTTYGQVRWTVTPHTHGHTYDIRYYHHDNVGNNTRYINTDIRLRVDDVAPTVVFSPNNQDFTNEDIPVEINANDEDSGVKRIRYRIQNEGSWGSWSSWINEKSNVVNLSKQGKSQIQVQAEDNIGNQNVYNSDYYYIDKDVPSISLSQSPTNWTNNNVVISADIPDQNGNITVKKWAKGDQNASWFNSNGNTLDSSFSVSSNDTYSVYAKNKSGSESVMTIKVDNIDKEKPILSITPNTMDVTHDDMILTTAATDNKSGVKRIGLPNDTWVDRSEAIYKVKENGTYSFLVEDHAGNQTTESIAINNIDKTSSFENPSIENLSSTTLKDTAETITTSISPITVKDWRDDTNKWRLDVSASQLKLVGESHLLPTGSIRLKPISNINRISGSGTIPTKFLLTTEAIDKGKTTVVESDNARGEYNVLFQNDALEIVIDPTTAKIGKYESTITWDLIIAP